MAYIASALNQDVNFGCFLIFSFSSAALFLFCVPLKTLSFISAQRVIHLEIVFKNLIFIILKMLVFSPNQELELYNISLLVTRPK